MKKLLFTVAISFLFGHLTAQETIEISGTIKGAGNDMFTLHYRSGDDRLVDTIIAKNDVISFKKAYKLPNLVWADLLYKGDKVKGPLANTGFFIQNGTPVVLDGDVMNLYAVKAQGSPLFGDVTKLREANQSNWSNLSKLYTLMEQHSDLLGEEIVGLLKKKFDSIVENYNTVEKEFIEGNKNSVFAGYMYSKNLLGKSADEVEAYYTGLSEEVKTSPFGQQILTYLETAKKVAPGAVAPAFTQKDINGKTVTLKQFKGKYVLMCFWGSWCGPCRMSHPHLMELVNTYKDEKFQVIGFASDKNKDKWKEAIEKDKLDFIHCNLFDRYKGEDVGALYNVKAFPTKVLIDPDGKIVGTVIGMGEPESKQLDDMLKTAFGK
ncbi:MAG: TlpA family protein disulfide reductase [Bacteroidales bacterium]|jgi:peroxiredoxin|nr:TlpA family protein disulfide reductase [Bacteroidales bacterium]